MFTSPPLPNELISIPAMQCMHNQIYIPKYSATGRALCRQKESLRYYLQYGKPSDLILAKDVILPYGVRWRDICALILADLCDKHLVILTSDLYGKRDKAINGLLEETTDN